MKIAVIGIGHVGLVTCATLAHFNHEVVGTDVDSDKVSVASEGRSPFYEPGLDDLLRTTMATGRLSFTDNAKEAIAGAEVIFICVGTPPKVSGEANLIAVEESARNAARLADRPAVIVEKSTVPFGTSKRLRLVVERENPAHELSLCSNPEFLREGRAIQDSLEPERILVGVDSDQARRAMREVYAKQIEAGIPFIETNIETAELAKHACNAFLAMKISFINGISHVAEKAGADVTQIADVMGSDSRIGRSFLNAGLGYGGSCFWKDIAAFDRLSTGIGYDFGLLREVARINDEALQSVFDKVREVLWNLDGKRVAVWGLAFKPQTDDIRFSPALELAKKLMEEGAVVVAYDPVAGPNAQQALPQLTLANDPYEAASGAAAVVLATEWPEFREIDLTKLKEVMGHPVMIDGRNQFAVDEMKAAGFAYWSVGRPPV